VFQAVIIIVLAIRLRIVDRINASGGRPSDALWDQVEKKQKQIKWMYIVICALYVILASLMIGLSFPAADIISNMVYYYLHCVQLTVVTIALLSGLTFMIAQVNEIAIWQS